MRDVIWATPLYKFLRECNSSPLEKVVLDCGAGGDDLLFDSFMNMDTKRLELKSVNVSSGKQRISAKNT
jgi:hypothetical protein